MKEETLNLNEAAIFFRMSPETLRRKIYTDDIPAYKSGKCWMFLLNDLIRYIRSRYQVENNFYLTTEKPSTEEINILTCKKNKHLLINGYSSKINIETEYQKRLHPTPKLKQKNKKH